MIFNIFTVLFYSPSYTYIIGYSQAYIVSYIAERCPLTIHLHEIWEMLKIIQTYC